MGTKFIIAQCVGAIGVISYMVSFQIKSNKLLYGAQAIGNFAFSIQFLLLGAATGAYNVILNIFRNMALVKYNEWKWIQHKGWVVLLSAITIGIMIITWNGPVSILAAIANIASHIGMWTNNAQKIRLANLACISPAWLLYDFLVGAYAGVLNESIILSSIIISIYRYGWKQMGDPNSEFQK